MLKIFFVSFIMSLYVTESMIVFVIVSVGVTLMFVNPLLLSSSKFSILMLGLNLSLLMVWILLSVLMTFVDYKTNSLYFKEIKLLLFFMLVILLGFFFTDKFLMLYILFELSMLPLVGIILGWGSQPERVQAAVYMFMYTVVASLPLLVIILNLSMEGLNYFLSMDLSFSVVKPWLGFICIPFLVKVPAFMFHLWLPKAHVESPAGGSMILAGVMLKIGFYGICQVAPLLGGDNLVIFLIVGGVVGGLSSAAICLRQMDMKRLVAYSSVCHMGLMMVGLFSGGDLGLGSLAMICLSHGLTSSGLFFLSGEIYSQVATRSMMLIKGIMMISPMVGLWMFIFCVSNMAAPFTLGVMGEIGILASSVGSSFILMGLMMLYSFMSASYSVYLFSTSCMGGASLLGFKLMSVKDNLVLTALFMPLVLMMLSSDLMMV